MARGDTIAIVERIYEPSSMDDEAWMRSICEAVRRASGAVVFGNLVDAHDPRRVRYWAEVVAGLPQQQNPIPKLARALAEPANRALFMQPPRTETLSERMGRAGLDAAPLLKSLWPLGIRDVFGVTAPGADGRGPGFGIGLPELRKSTAPERQRWQRVAAHLSAGYRLRREIARKAAPEAVLRPDGRVEHAEPAARSGLARELLRAAARGIDRARAQLRHEDPDGALDLWKGLVAGRWSLVDSFENDGRRYLIARRNEPDAPCPQALTRREAQVAAYAALGHGNKLIAYELGLSVSTVATHLASARRKLRARSRLDFAPLIAPRPTR